MSCYICADPKKETRPYGENGQSICFDCMMADPDRQRTAEKNFATLLAANAALGDGCVVIGGTEGPEPLDLNH